MELVKVYEAIEGELDYQADSIGPKCVHGNVPPVAAELLLIEEYVLRARKAWTDGHSDPAAGLDELRKIIGIGVRCARNHGLPSRKPLGGGVTKTK
jgi:hypothetical protein